MKVLKSGIMLCCIISLLTFSTVLGQVISSVPPTTGNDRHLDEVFTEIKRPGLSVVSFDNGGDHSKGYGLKQLLNQVYILGTNNQKELFKSIINYSVNREVNTISSDENIIEENSNILQYRAFEALCSFI